METGLGDDTTAWRRSVLMPLAQEMRLKLTVACATSKKLFACLGSPTAHRVQITTTGTVHIFLILHV